MLKRTFLTLLMRIATVAWLLGSAVAAGAADEFLDPELAFKLAARAVDERTIELTYTVAPGYYLYHEQFKFVASDATLGTPAFPPGKVKFDETFQKNVETHRDQVVIRIPVTHATGGFKLTATNQGCADKGLCYPPMDRVLDVRLAATGGNSSVTVLPNLDGNAAALRIASSPSDSGSGAGAQIDAALRSGKFWPAVAVFFVAGVLLSLTPCVLPMLPILSSIIVGQGGGASRGRGLGLALSYSLGMATIYTALGVAAGLAGEGLAASLQSPWVLSAFAVALVALSLSMFGVYELQLPEAFTGRMARAAQRLPAGRFASVFAMGGVSALIVSPCVAAPLAGALVYLSQTRDVALGGSALFALAAGMSVPLLLIGASAGALLPRAGVWMGEVKRFFGVLLLGVALWTVQPVLPGAAVLALWGALFISASALLLSSRTGPDQPGRPTVWRHALAAILAVCGLLELVGAASGGTNVVQPLAHLSERRSGGSSASEVVFAPVRSVAELDAAIATAGRTVVLDFYADWCVSCKEMERLTYTDPLVQRKLNRALLLKADVTANNAQDRELLKRFHLYGPPGTLFFDVQGQEVTQARVVGYQNTERFLQTLETAGL